MAAGDGFADIFGRRWGSVKWPWSSRKSLVGTAAFVAGAAAVTLGEIWWFNQFGLLPALTWAVAAKVLAISLACGLVELVPSERLLPGKLGDDNITVPVAAALLAALLL